MHCARLLRLQFRYEMRGEEIWEGSEDGRGSDMLLSSVKRREMHLSPSEFLCFQLGADQYSVRDWFS